MLQIIKIFNKFQHHKVYFKLTHYSPTLSIVTQQDKNYSSSIKTIRVWSENKI